jgi:DNA-binding NtrC family response regulator
MSTLLTSRNQAVQALARRLERLVPTELPLILEGETGTGKSRLARRIHAASRRGRPLVIADCAGLPAGLIASELFGHRAGAFTDATRARRGLLARAGAGTMVLDRVETLPSEGQVALLRVLDERSFTPVGAATTSRFDARVLATADTGLGDLVDSGTLRRDLYHRLAGLHVVLPPLRERPEDVLPAARAALRREARRLSVPLALSEAGAAALAMYPWPGNFRELETVVTRAAVGARGEEIGPDELALPESPWPQTVRRAAERGLTLVQVERMYVQWVVAAEGGNLTRAARRLGVSRRTLIRWRESAPDIGKGR